MFSLVYCPISDQKRNYPHSLLHFIAALNSRIRSFSSHLILLGDCKTTWVIINQSIQGINDCTSQIIYRQYHLKFRRISDQNIMIKILF